MKYWLNWRDVSGVPSTVEDLRTLLSKYSRQSLLIACSRLSVELNFGAEGKTVASDALTKKFIPVLFPPELAAKVNLAFQHDRVIFFQGQLRYIAAEATRIPCAAHDDPPAIENYELGELLLRAAEIMMLKLPRPTDPLDALASFVAEFVPVYEIDTPTDAFDQLMRIYIMLTVNIPRLASKGPLKFDVAAEFEKIFGFSLTDYINFMFALLMHAMADRDARQANADPPSPVGPYWLKTTTLSEETIHKVLTTISFSLADMPPLKDPHGYADFTFLRDHPYIRDGEHYFCLDYEFALGKLESGVMWRVLDSLDEKQKEPYLSFWGPVFEDYLAWLFESYASTKHNTYYPSPEYADGTQVCDAIVVCGDKPLVIAPLVTMSSGSIERAMRPLAKMPFSTILEDRITADRQLGRPFEAASKYVFKGTARSLPKHIELMSDAFRNVIKDFGITEEDGSPATL